MSTKSTRTIINNLKRFKMSKDLRQFAEQIFIELLRSREDAINLGKVHRYNADSNSNLAGQAIEAAEVAKDLFDARYGVNPNFKTH